MITEFNILVAIIATPILFQKLGESSFGLMNLSFSILIYGIGVDTI